MKIMHVETGRHLYGGALQVFYLVRGLHAAGMENLLVCPAGSAIAREAAPFAAIHDVPVHGDLDILFGWRLWQLVKQARPDILHIHSRRGADLWGCLVARLTGQTAILTRRVDNPESRWLAGFKYRPYQKVVAISDGIRQVLLTEGVAVDKLHRIHSAVDFDAWQVPRDRSWFEAEFSIGRCQKAVGVIAQLIDRKGHRFLIDAIPAIVQKVPDARFLFLGQGPLETDLKQRCLERSLGHMVHFAGFRGDLPRIMPNLDLVVHPALMEGLGVSLLQAGAAGIPIVAGRSGGIPEVVKDGQNGVLLDPRDTAMLSSTVIDLLSNPQRARAMGGMGQEMVHNHFSIAAMVNAYRTLYDQ